MLIYGIIGWLLCAIITGILLVKVIGKYYLIDDDDGIGIIILLMSWPLALIILMCEAFVMYVKYIKNGKKERVENLKQEKRNEVESILKEI